MAEFEDTRVWS